MMETHEQFDDLLPGYALGILDDEDVALVASHLEKCGGCRRTVTEFRAIAADLTLLIEEKVPHHHVKSRLLKRIKAKKVRGLAGYEMPPWLSGVWQPALAMLVLVLIAGNVLLFMQIRQNQQTAVGDFQPVLLAGSEHAPEASGLIVMSDDGEHGTLIVQHLPSLDESQAYQLWLIDSDGREDGGVFRVSRGGYAAIWVYADKPLAAYENFGITIEPEGGSEQPTGANVLTLADDK